MDHFSIRKWTEINLTNTRTKYELQLRNLESSDLTRRIKDIDDELAFFYNNRNLFDIVITNDYTEGTCTMLQQLISERLRSVQNV